jgi:Domain of unknown function (DUF6457)
LSSSRTGKDVRTLSKRFPKANRSSHQESVDHARLASDSSPKDASAFGEPKRELAPPSNSTPDTGWLEEARERLEEASGVRLELTDGMRATLLDLARTAAHESGERRNAPLLCYLLGRADRGSDLDVLTEALRR